MAAKVNEVEGCVDIVEAKLTEMRGDMEVIWGDLQKLGKLEHNVDSLGKQFGRFEALLQKLSEAGHSEGPMAGVTLRLPHRH